MSGGDSLGRRALAALLFVAAIVAAASGDLHDPDIWWNVAAGEHLVRTGEPPPMELWGEHECPNVRPYELRGFQMVAGLAWTHGGYWGLFLLRGACVLALALLSVIALRRALPLDVALLGAAVVLGAASFRLTVRGETFAYVLFLAVLIAFERLLVARSARAAAGWGLLAFAAHLAWSWSHGSFPLALALPACALVGLPLDRGGVARARRVGLAALALCGAIALYPQGLRAILIAFEERHFAEALGLKEWTPSYVAVARGWRDPSLFPALALLVGLVVAALGARGARERGWRLLAGAGFLVVGAGNLRSLPFFACAALVWLPLCAALEARTARMLAALGVVTSALATMMACFEAPVLRGEVRSAPDLAPTKIAPMHALEVARREGLDGRIFARVPASSWIVLHEYPRLRVLWSGRITYTLECGLELGAARSGDWELFERVDRRLAPRTVLVEHVVEPALFDALVEHGWRLAAFDLRFALLVSPSAPSSPGSGAPNAGGVLSAREALAYENRPVSFLPEVLANACERLRMVEPVRAEGYCAEAAARGARVD